MNKSLCNFIVIYFYYIRCSLSDSYKLKPSNKLIHEKNELNKDFKNRTEKCFRGNTIPCSGMLLRQRMQPLRRSNDYVSRRNFFHDRAYMHGWQMHACYRILRTACCRAHWTYRSRASASSININIIE